MNEDLIQQIRDNAGPSLVEYAENNKGYVPTKEFIFYSWHRILRAMKYIPGAQTSLDYFKQETEFLKKFVRENNRNLVDIGLGRILNLLEMEMSLKDRSLRGIDSVGAHGRSVAQYAVDLGKMLDLSSEQINQLYIKGILHDVGKIAISDYILGKPSGLSPEEFEKIKEHPSIGDEILSSMQELFGIPVENLIPGVKFHHERYDGKGYPLGLSGGTIPLDARIIALGDSFDVMMRGRSYKPPMTLFQAVSEIVKNEGMQFDPEIAQVAVKALPNTYQRLKKPA